jgi:hypothetical protein
MVATNWVSSRCDGERGGAEQSPMLPLTRARLQKALVTTPSRTVLQKRGCEVHVHQRR